ncbi:hypothetical protein JOB18_005278 [Solea senegalensis]|uniref:Uncharacterized protein n=1 Tax=Solea senegalensis TaxID=28829 RepID=A0AAV6PYE4_SOLSE|nr:hypothetical protein JOB18_005278 [Solea senegalensis]
MEVTCTYVSSAAAENAEVFFFQSIRHECITLRLNNRREPDTGDNKVLKSFHSPQPVQADVNSYERLKKKKKKKTEWRRCEAEHLQLALTIPAPFCGSLSSSHKQQLVVGHVRNAMRRRDVLHHSTTPLSVATETQRRKVGEEEEEDRTIK